MSEIPRYLAQLDRHAFAALDGNHDAVLVIVYELHAPGAQARGQKPIRRRGRAPALEVPSHCRLHGAVASATWADQPLRSRMTG